MCSNVVATTSSDIPLGVALVAPGQTYSVPLDKLYTGVNYHLECDIKYNVQSKSIYSDIQVFCPSNTKILKNGSYYNCDVSSGTVLYFETKGSMFSFSSIDTTTNIQIRNLDYTDTISVNCVAKVGS
jgi:hypothetical protein